MAIVLVDFGGPTQLFAALEQSAGPEAASVFPPMGHEVLGFVAIAAWTMGTAIGYGGDAAPMAGAMEGQRILSYKNERESAKMYVSTMVVLFLLLATLTLPGLAAMVHWPEVGTEAQKELAYGMLLAKYLPPGLLGLALSAVLASIMSTVSSNMNFGAQVLVNDVYQRSLVKQASTKHYLLMGRIFSAGILILGVVVAVAATNVIQTRSSCWVYLPPS
ncbi:putative transporter [Blastopirellula retiformator]|uniref:Putative transporter n=1 Tax=Blastopirellula retiformator TaxID=2527970 RepID=A0A5C5V6W1_9BACT|nr:putative transporter [Blastopirellula retiformator]